VLFQKYPYPPWEIVWFEPSHPFLGVGMDIFCHHTFNKTYPTTKMSDA